MAFAISAQSTSPRFGTLKNQDNTGRVLNYKVVSVTDATGADSSTLSTNAYYTYVDITAVDSLTLKNPTVTNCYYGDYMVIIIHASSGTPFVKFYGANWLTAGKATLSTNKRAVITLVFDGAKWVEVSRTVQ